MSKSRIWHVTIKWRESKVYLRVTPEEDCHVQEQLWYPKQKHRVRAITPRAAGRIVARGTAIQAYLIRFDDGGNDIAKEIKSGYGKRLVMRWAHRTGTTAKDVLIEIAK